MEKLGLNVGDCLLICLRKKENPDKVFEVEIILESEYCYLLRNIINGKKFWVEKVSITRSWDYNYYHFIEKMDPNTYRERKLERLTNKKELK